MTRTSFRALLLGSGMALAALPAHAQTTIDTEVTTPQRTSDTGDLTIATGGSVTPASGTGVTVDSDANVDVAGVVRIDNADDATGIDLQSGNSGDLTLSGSVTLVEDFAPDDVDDDGIQDGPLAQGSGRTGILISGSGTFTGNVTAAAGSQVQIEGNDSAAVRLASGTTLDGDIAMGGTLAVLGARSVALDLAGRTTGEVSTTGTINTQGEGAQAVRVEGDVEGGYANSGSIANSGYRFTQRPNQQFRDLLGEEDLLQAGAAVQISGNVAGGLFFREVTETTVDGDGNETTTVTARSALTQAGAAPALLVDGEGTPIAIGVVAEITDPSADDFDPDLQFAFINQGSMSASGIYDDVGATVFEARDVSFEGGLSNTGSMTAQTFRSGDDGTADVPGFDAAARIIVLGDNALAERLNNSGIIQATVSEAVDAVFADRANVLPARQIDAVAIDIAATAELAEITNSGTIAALVTGRAGQAIAVRDASGTLSLIDNTGRISAIGQNSDVLGLETTDFNLVALDLRNNTVGVRIDQRQSDEDGSLAPSIIGDIFLGSGDDVVSSTAGSLLGDLSFGDGEDTLTLADTFFSGTLSDMDGQLVLAVTGDSSVALGGGAPVGVTSASFGAGTTFRPSIDGANGTAAALVASDSVTFEDGATVTPFLTSLATGGLTRFAIAQGETLTVEGDISSLGAGFTPFLYDTSYTLDPATNTLFVDLAVRSPEELGLDTAQAGAFPAAFAALGSNNQLAAAIVNITEADEFNAAYNQLLPEFSAASRQFILANVDGAVGAVGSHLDSARRSQERGGGVWFQEFAYFADRELSGLSEQYRGYGFGFTGGIDRAMGPFHAVGLNLGFASTEIEDVVGVDEPLDVTTALAGVYAGLEIGGLSFDAYGGAGFNSFETNRLISIGNFQAESAGDYDGFHVNGSLRAGYDVPVGGRFWMRPTVSLDYLSLREDGYTEDGPLGVALSLDDRDVDSAAVTAMFNVGANFMGRRTWVRPSLRVGYRQEFLDDVLTTGTFAGLDTPFSILAGEFPDEGVLVGLSVAAGSEYSSFSFDLDSDVRDGFIRHTGRIVVRLLF